MKWGISIIVFCLVVGVVVFFVFRPQSQVAWEKFVQKVNKEIGEEDVRIKELELRYQDLRQGWEKQIYAKHQLAVMAQTKREKADQYEQELKSLEQKLLNIRESIDSGRPYTGKTGRVYSPSDLVRLSGEVESLIAEKKQEKDREQQLGSTYERFSTRALELQNKAKTSLDELRGNIDMLKDKRRDLFMLKEQVELAKTITQDISLNYESIRAAVDRSVADIEGKIRANEELLDIYMESSPTEQLKNQLDDF